MPVRRLTAHLAAVAVATAACLVGVAAPAFAAGSSGSSSGATSGSAGSSVASGSGGSGTSAAQLSLAALPGVVVSASDTNNYGTSGSETLVEAAPDGSGRRVLLRLGSESLVGLLALSPDGSELAYFRETTKTAELQVMNLSSGHTTTPFELHSKSAFISGITWDGTDDLVIGTNVRPGSSPAKESALYELPAAGGKMTRLTGFDDVGTPVVAPDGDLVYVSSKTFSSTSGYDRSELWVANPDGSDPRPLVSSSRFIAGPTVSPDGQTVAFAVTKSSVTSHLAAVPLAGGTVTDLTPAVKGRSDILPCWSPDGNEIAFMSSRAGRTESSKDNQLMDAYVMTAGGAEVTPLIAYTGDKKSVDLLTWGA